MPCQITVLFDDGYDLEFNLSAADIARFDPHSARAWLGREFETAGCVPANPMGKLLLADMVICLARKPARAAWDEPAPWVRDYLAAAAAALDKPFIAIDLARNSLGY